MEVMDELSFKILADGQQKIQINEFRDIDVELGFSEKKQLESIPENIPQNKQTIIQHSDSMLICETQSHILGMLDKTFSYM